MLPNINEAVALANYLTATILAAVSTFALWRFKDRFAEHSDARQIIVGAKIVMIALLVHEMYWGAQWLLYPSYQAISEAMIRHSWIVTLTYWMAFYGFGKIAATVFAKSGHIGLNGILTIAAIWFSIFATFAAY